MTGDHNFYHEISEALVSMLVGDDSIDFKHTVNIHRRYNPILGDLKVFYDF